MLAIAMPAASYVGLGRGTGLVIPSSPMPPGAQSDSREKKTPMLPKVIISPRTVMNKNE